jgi:hypothetical protein
MYPKTIYRCIVPPLSYTKPYCSRTPDLHTPSTYLEELHGCVPRYVVPVVHLHERFLNT